MYSILTCADTKFYSMACILAKNISLYPNCKLFLYDLGLKDLEKKNLVRLGVTIEYVKYNDDIFLLNKYGNIRATHKIDCIKHFLRKYKKNVVVVDADIFFIDDCVQDIFPDDDEIVVTYRCDREKKPYILLNGKINTGVMGFGKNVGDDFFYEWHQLCIDKDHTDQSALSLLLDKKISLEKINTIQYYNKNKVRIFDGNIYNDVTCRIGKIFHFKSAGRKRNKYIGFILFSNIYTKFTKLSRWLVCMNRKYRLFVWRSNV